MGYDYLYLEKAPRIIREAIQFLGIKEIIGPKNNNEIITWSKALKLDKIYTADEIAWCGLFVAYVCHLAGLEVIEGPLWAKNWSRWGTRQTIAMLGDILVFSRGNGGHVGIYVGEDDVAYHVLGGNQTNSVSITRIVKKRCIAIRRTKWKIAQPSNIRVVKLTASGEISFNEV